MSPLYDYRCSAGHTFEKNVPMANRDLQIPCEFYESYTMPNPAITASTVDPQDIELVGSILTQTHEVRCQCMATRVFSHSNPRAMLDHNMAANRDAAREGRYDPLSPSKRGMGSGRHWRK